MTEILDRSALRAELVRRRLRGTAAPKDNSIRPVRRDVPLVLSSAWLQASGPMKYGANPNSGSGRST
jgi:hypothetical protein